MRRFGLGLMLACVSVTAMASTLEVPLRGRGGVTFDVPDDWHSQVRSPRPDLPPTVAIASPVKNELLILITPIWPASAAVAAPAAEDILNMVRGAAASAKPKAVESDLPIVDLAVPGVAGYYFSATDRAPAPDEYRYLTQGALGLGELRVTFTILMNGDPGSLRTRALGVVRSIRRRSAT